MVLLEDSFLNNTQNSQNDPLEESGSRPQDSYIHIRIQQRNGRKTLTTVQGIDENHNMKLLIRKCKKLFACNGTIIEDPGMGTVIQLQGDQRQGIQKLLIQCNIATAETIKIHGF